MRLPILALAFALVAITPSAAQSIKVCVPQRGIWETSPPDMGKVSGIFKKHGVELDITYTQAAGDSIQAVIAQSCVISPSIGLLATMGAFSKGAPVRIISAVSTGFAEAWWYVTAASPIKSFKDADGKSFAFSSQGSSTMIAGYAMFDHYGVKGRGVAAGALQNTWTQVRSGQIDIGWATPPFQLDELRRGEIRMIGRGNEVPALRAQTSRVQIANADWLDKNRDLARRYMLGWRETLDWMYSGPEAMKAYMDFSGFNEASVKQMMTEFIPREDLQSDEIRGIKEATEDAIKHKYITAPLSEAQWKEMVQIPAR
jgi:NitT/TauT family transport system substrate-binding protein